MTWIRIDDEMAEHPKFRSVGGIGLAIQTAALCYCGKHLTDGFLSHAAANSIIHLVLNPITDESGRAFPVAIMVPNGMASAIADVKNNIAPAITGAMAQLSPKPADEIDWKKMMVRAGLWEERDGGYFLHDFQDYNPTKAQVLSQREKKRKAGIKGAKRRWGSETPDSTTHSTSHSRGKENDSTTYGTCHSNEAENDGTTHGKTMAPYPLSPKDKDIPGSEKPIRQVVINKWFEYLKSLQIQKWNKVRLTESQINLLINPNRKTTGRCAVPGFGSYHVLACTLQLIQADIDDLFAYLHKIASDERAANVYIKKSEGMKTLDLNLFPEFEEGPEQPPEPPVEPEPPAPESEISN